MDTQAPAATICYWYPSSRFSTAAYRTAGPDRAQVVTWRVPTHNRRVTRTRSPRDDGPPAEIYLYRTPQGWRRTTRSSRGAQHCGTLPWTGPEADDDAAKDAAEGLISSLCTEFFGLAVDVSWRTAANGSGWIGTVHAMPGSAVH